MVLNKLRKKIGNKILPDNDRPQKIKKEYESKLEITRKKNDKIITSILKHSGVLVKQGEFSSAEMLLKLIESDLSKNERYLLTLGNCLFSLHKFKKAEVCFRALNEMKPENSRYVERIADCLSGMDMHAKAVDTLRAIENPDNKILRRIEQHRILSRDYSDVTLSIMSKAKSLQSENALICEESERILSDLNQSGIAFSSVDALLGKDSKEFKEALAQFNDFCSKENVSERAKDISNTKDFNGDSGLNGIFKPSVISYKDYVGDINNGMPIFKLFSHKKIVNIANLYNGMASKICNLTMWYNPKLHPDNVNGRTGSQIWHRDQEDEKVFKCFIYFSDITKKSGATQYIKSTSVGSATCQQLHPFPNHTGYPHNKIIENNFKDDKIVTAEGKVGTIVMIDTSGFHRGGFTTENERRIGLCTYLRPITPLYKDVSTKVKITEPICGDDAVAYATHSDLT